MRKFLFLLTVLLAGTVPVLAQPFKLIRAYEGTAHFLRQLDATPAGEREALYEQTAVGPFNRTCPARGSSFSVAPASTDPKELKAWLEAARASNIDAIVMQALEQAAGVLKGPETTTVCVYLADPASPVQFMQGVGGIALGSAPTMVLYVNPRFQGWAERLPYVTAHEYHHVVVQSRDRGRSPRTPLFILALEGRADAFASRLHPGIFAPWTQGAPPEQELRIWNEIQPLLRSRDSSFYPRYMIGDGRSVPYWSGYTIGAHMVEKFLKANPGLSVDEWTNLDPETILRKSGYAGVRAR